MKSTNRRRLRLSSSLSLVVGLLFVRFAVVGATQDSETYFHQGARHFLATNEIAQARQVVTNGLKVYPDDAKLKKLWELLNQKGQSQSQSEQKKDQQDQSESDQQQSKDQQSKEQRQKEEQARKEQQKQQEQAAQQEKKEGEDKKGQQTSPKPEQGDQQEEGEAQPQGRAVQMTPQQAIQLLEALKGEERVMPFRPVLKTNRQDRVFKDW